MERAELERRLALVRAYETDFAYRLGKVVVNKPRLSIWLFLVPVLLIYHFQELRRFKENLPGFIQGFACSKLQALAAVGAEMGSPETGSGAATAAEAVAAAPAVPPAQAAELEAKQGAEQRLLREHYRVLLAQPGRDYAAMLRGVYPDREAYQEFLGRLQGAENAIYRVLQAGLPPESEEAAVIARMERESLRLRGEEVRRLFPLPGEAPRD